MANFSTSNVDKLKNDNSTFKISTKMQLESVEKGIALYTQISPPVAERLREGTSLLTITREFRWCKPRFLRMK